CGGFSSPLPLCFFVWGWTPTRRPGGPPPTPPRPPWFLRSPQRASVGWCRRPGRPEPRGARSSAFVGRVVGVWLGGGVWGCRLVCVRVGVLVGVLVVVGVSVGGAVGVSVGVSVGVLVGVSVGVSVGVGVSGKHRTGSH